jgi:hypothetical protein
VLTDDDGLDHAALDALREDDPARAEVAHRAHVHGAPRELAQEAPRLIDGELASGHGRERRGLKGGRNRALRGKRPAHKGRGL